MQDFSRESYRLIPQYLPHYAKMMEDKDIDTRALMAEAFSVAVQVLARFDGIEPHEVVASADTRTFIRTASTLARSTGNTGSTMSRHRKMCRH